MKKKLQIYLILGLVVFSGLGVYLWMTPHWRAYLVLLAHPTRPLEYLDSFKVILPPDSPFPMRITKRRITRRILKIASESQDRLREVTALTDLVMVISSHRSQEYSKYSSQALELLKGLSSEIARKESPEKLVEFSRLFQSYNPDISQGYALEGLAFYRMHNLDEAQTALEQSMARKPFVPTALLRLLKIYQQKSRYSHIAKLIDDKREKLPESHFVYSLAGNAYLRSNRPDEAIPMLQKAVNLKPDSFEDHRSLGEIGLLMDLPELVEHLKRAYELNNLNTELAKEWVRYQLVHEKPGIVVEFFKNPGKHLIHYTDFQLLYLDALVSHGNVAEFEQLISRVPGLSGKKPILLFFEGLLNFNKKKYEAARASLEKFLKVKGQASRKRRAIQALIKISKIQKQHGLTRFYLKKLMEIDPQESSLHLQLSNSFLEQGLGDKAIVSLLRAVELFPSEQQLVIPAAKLLMKKGAYLKSLQILNSLGNVYQSTGPCLLMFEAYSKTGNSRAAELVLQRGQAARIIQKPLPKHLAKSLHESRLAAVDLSSIRETEESLIQSMFQQASKVDKSTLPPSPELSRKLTLDGEILRDYHYTGFAELFIPEGTNVGLIEALTDEQLAFFKEGDQRADFYLARHEGQLHRVQTRYLKILEYPDGEILGKGIITGIDENYKTLAKIQEIFRGGDAVQVIASRAYGLNRSILLDDENIVSFLSSPDESLSIQIGPRTFHDVPPNLISLPSRYAFLAGRHFSDVVELPPENRLVLLGPDQGAVSIFEKGDKGPELIHSTQVFDAISRQRYANAFPRISYKGYLAIDCNRDNILDIVSLWQSQTDSKEGVIHILLSSGIEEFSDYLLPTRLDFLENYQTRRRISPLHFVRDLNQDGILEFILYQPVKSPRNPGIQIPFYEVYHPRIRSLKDVSAQFPDFLEDQANSLRDLQNHKKRESGLNQQYQEWFQGYLKAMRKLRSYSPRTKGSRI